MPTSRVAGTLIIRALILTVGLPGLGFIVATTMAVINIMATIPVTGTTRPFTVGPIVRGARRCLGVSELAAGVGSERHGMATMADISRPIPFTRRRRSGLQII